jgi:hypothetical protein
MPQLLGCGGAFLSLFLRIFADNGFGSRHQSGNMMGHPDRQRINTLLRVQFLDNPLAQRY